MATLHLKPKSAPKNVLSVSVDIDGQMFSFSYDLPDVGGQIAVTDRNRTWIEAQIREGLKTRFGKMIPQEA